MEYGPAFGPCTLVSACFDLSQPQRRPQDKNMDDLKNKVLAYLLAEPDYAPITLKSLAKRLKVDGQTMPSCDRP